MSNKGPKRYRTVHSLVTALVDGEIPPNVVSPGSAASQMGTSRQAVHQQILRGTLRAWTAEGVVLIDGLQVRRKARHARGIAETQGELLDAT